MRWNSTASCGSIRGHEAEPAHCLAPRLALTLLTTQALAAEPETVWLSSLDLSPIVQGWGQPQADKAVTGKPLSIGGKTFERGLGTHTDSLVRLQLKGGVGEVLGVRRRG